MLLAHLGTVDMLDLVASAAHFYDLLTPREGQLGFRFAGSDLDSLTSRLSAVGHNIQLLKKVYSEYWDPRIPPRNIREFLIKMYWLSYLQVLWSVNQARDMTRYLNWADFRGTLRNMYLNPDQTTSELHSPSFDRLIRSSSEDLASLCGKKHPSGTRSFGRSMSVSSRCVSDLCLQPRYIVIHNFHQILTENMFDNPVKYLNKS